ncbi:MAG: HAMP domain-containing histidine kinase [Deltaproteobacteria bacterium]|nr:HAMP domain-containing histidine kinase [Deltaproteobacteria bacterium]
MSNFFQILKQLSEEDNDRLLKVARFAELGINASAVIHELRQPMTALSMTLQMIQEGIANKSEDVGSNLAEAMKLASRTEQLINRARDFMNPTTNVTEVDLVESITRVLSAYQWQLGKHSCIQLKAHVPEHLPHIVADQTQIEQMLANLIVNSMDAVRNVGHPVILVEVHSQTDNAVEFVVADNGHGMSEEVQKKAFEPFFSTKGDAQGTGLGLFIVAQIVARYEGKIRVLDENELRLLQVPNLKTGIALILPTGVIN